MEAIGCLVPELRSENVVLCKIDSCSCKKAARKSEKTVGKDSGGESGGLHCLYRQKDNHIP